MIVIIIVMTTKGFAEIKTNIETPNDISISEKPLKSNKINSKSRY